MLRVVADGPARDEFAAGRCRRGAARVRRWAEVLPLLYLHGLSSGDFAPELEEFFGSKAGLSASAIVRLTTDWQQEQRSFAERDLSNVDYVYVWVDRVHFTVRLDEARLCTLVIVGVRGRRAQGAGGVGRRAPGVHRVVGRPAARLPPPQHARPGARGRGRRVGVLGRAARGVSRYERAAMLGTQSRERDQLSAQVGPAGGPPGHRRDP
jgi:Transposase, Mutator family